MTDQPVAEREPAPRRKAHYAGDKRHLIGDGPETWLGPDRRGIIWRPCHAEYDAPLDRTLVIFAPVATHELAKVPGLVERLQHMQQQQAAAMGATARIGGMQ